MVGFGKIIGNPSDDFLTALLVGGDEGENKAS
jgi:hypothetical protein